MGVHHLWDVLKEAKAESKLADLGNKTFAVDLATWICESEGVKPLQGYHAPSYIRNLFFRVSIMMKANIHLIFILDGKAPTLKLDTIASRLGSNSGSPKKQSSGTRTRLNQKLKECCKLLDALGIPWIKAEGEAEALCARLNEVGLVDGVITNDGDAFLYGAETVLRNFSVEKNSVIEMYTMESVQSKLGYDRNDLIGLGLLLGCDYYPKGVPGIGVAQATKLISSFGDANVLDVFSEWQSGKYHNVPFSSRKPSHCSTCGHEGSKKDHVARGCDSCGEECVMKKSRAATIPCTCDWHKNETSRKAYQLEDKVRSAALQDPSFPDGAIIREFTRCQNYMCGSSPVDPSTAMDILKKITIEKCPDLEEACRYLMEKLEWGVDYAFGKVLPLLTYYILGHRDSRRKESVIKFDRILKKRVVDFVPSLEVKWTLPNVQLISSLQDPDGIVTVEPESAMALAYPDAVDLFHKDLRRQKEDRKRSKAASRKTDGKTKASKNEATSSPTNMKITDFFKAKKQPSYSVKHKATERVSQTARVMELERRLEEMTISSDSRPRSDGGLDNKDENGLASRQTGHILRGSKQSVCVGGNENAAMRKVARRVIIFSSDSESESDDTTEICPTDTVNDSENITFSADINFSLLSSPLNDRVCDNKTTPTSGKQANPLRECSLNVSAKEANEQTTPVKIDCEQDSLTTDSPVFMTLMERLKARKQVKGSTQ